MTPSPECIALLRSIAADPEDDTPRLVFADWLDENRTGDADQARAEFIRLSCQLKTKQRLTPAEGKWLDANVKRLLPTVMTKLKKAKAPDGFSRSGRKVRIHTSLDRKEEFGEGHIFLEIEFWRGFARRITYGSMLPTSVQNIGRELAIDEPLAIHAPESFLLPYTAVRDPSRMWVNPPMCCGREVWDRVEGYSHVEQDTKVFAFGGRTEDEWVRFNREVVQGSIARAISALVHEKTGWPADWATGT